MVAAVVWVIALVIEYRYGFRGPQPGGGTLLFHADVTAFFLAQVGYLILLLGMMWSEAGGDGWFGRIAIGIWAVALGAIVLATLLDTLFAVKANFLLPVSGVGQILGSLLTSVAVVRARRWTRWRRSAPALWTAYFLSPLAAVLANIPVISIPAYPPFPSAPHPVAEALWQGAWFLIGLSLYIEAARRSGRVSKMSESVG